MTDERHGTIEDRPRSTCRRSTFGNSCTVRHVAYLVMVILLLTTVSSGCSGGELVPTAAPTPEISSHAGEDTMIQGQILAVMESWPLQLTLETAQGEFTVQLAETTTVYQNDVVVDPGILVAGFSIAVEGNLSGSTTMTAHSIRIIQ